MQFDNVDRGTVEQMVRAFYTKALNDKMIGPTFKKKLGDDMNSPLWYEHLKTIDKFWYTMITGEHGYKGHPFPPHVFLSPLTRKMFERWLELFKTTVDAYFIPQIAHAFYVKAEEFAEEFMENLSVDDEDEDW